MKTIGNAPVNSHSLSLQLSCFDEIHLTVGMGKIHPGYVCPKQRVGFTLFVHRFALTSEA